MEHSCPFCSAKATSRKSDEDYPGYWHYEFKCGTSYSRYDGKWTNMPHFGEMCSLANILNQEDHHTDIHRIQEMYERQMAHYARENELERMRESGELKKITVRFDRGYKTYIFEAPAKTEVGDVVVVESQYSSNGYATASVVELGGDYKGKLAQVVTVIEKRNK